MCTVSIRKIDLADRPYDDLNSPEALEALLAADALESEELELENLGLRYSSVM